MAHSSSIRLGGGGNLGLTSTQAGLRERENVRIQRLLESKQRAIGIDRQALDDHVAIHGAMRDAEKGRDDAMIAAMRAAAAEADALEAEQEERAMIETSALRGAWAAQGDRTTRAEWDLSDPTLRARELPPRDADGRPRPGVGVSSGQVFDGERLEDPRIDEDARRELIEGNEALLAAKRAEAYRRRAADDAMNAAAFAAAADADEMEEDAAAAARREAARFAMDNRALARAREVERADERRREAEADRETVRAGLESAMLAETHGAVVGAGGRIRKDEFKGLTQEQLAAIRAQQDAQAAELAARRAAEADRAARIADGEARAAAEAEAREDRAEAERREAQRSYYAEIKAQQRADRLRRQAEARGRSERFDETASGVLDGFGKSLR